MTRFIVPADIQRVMAASILERTEDLLAALDRGEQVDIEQVSQIHLPRSLLRAMVSERESDSQHDLL